jgi:hypothetical protein
MMANTLVSCGLNGKDKFTLGDAFFSFKKKTYYTR